MRVCIVFSFPFMGGQKSKAAALDGDAAFSYLAFYFYST